jgi:dienelactone hydrolase
MSIIPFEAIWCVFRTVQEVYMKKVRDLAPLGGAMRVEQRRYFLLSAGGLSLGTVLPGLTSFAQPRGTVLDEEWQDKARGRSVPVKIRVPATSGPWPVVMFSHGLGGSREGGVAWGEAWAAAGYLVLHLQHPGSDTGALRHIKESATPAQLLARFADVSFALDDMARRKAAGQAPWAQADLERVGLAGHSFGAKTVLGLAGERYPGASDERYPAMNSTSEKRIKAFIALSPSIGGREVDLAQRYGSLRGPMLHITGTLDGDVLGNGESPQSRTRPFEFAPAGDQYLWVLKDADHLTFDGLPPKPRLERVMRRSDAAKQSQPKQFQQVAKLTTLFWDAMLKNDAAARKQLSQPQGVAAGDVWQSK